MPKHVEHRVRRVVLSLLDDGTLLFAEGNLDDTFVVTNLLQREIALQEDFGRLDGSQMHEQYTFLPIGQTLNEEFILSLPKEQQSVADQINRRTTFSVTSLTYGL